MSTFSCEEMDVSDSKKNTAIFYPKTSVGLSFQRKVNVENQDRNGQNTYCRWIEFKINNIEKLIGGGGGGAYDNVSAKNVLRM